MTSPQLNSYNSSLASIKTLLTCLLHTKVSKSLLQSTRIGAPLSALKDHHDDLHVSQLAKNVKDAWVDVLNAYPHLLFDEAEHERFRAMAAQLNEFVLMSRDVKPLLDRGPRGIDVSNPFLVHCLMFDGVRVVPEESTHKERLVGMMEYVRACDPKACVAGWRMELHRRKAGESAGNMDAYYYSPDAKRFRSKNEVAKYLGVDPADVVLPKTAAAAAAPEMRQVKTFAAAAPAKRTKNGKSPLGEAIAKAKSIVVILGAGASTAAGLPDFRSKATGLHAAIAKGEFGANALPAELMFDYEVFEADQIPFYAFASKTFLPLIEEAKPTKTHAFVKLLDDKKKLLRCYTQNVDGLEVVAGVPAKKLLQCHGSIRSARCMKCGCKISEPYWWKVKTIANKGIPECSKPGCNGDLRPEIIFFGEAIGIEVDEKVQQDADKCDLIIVIGTSLSVQPVSKILSSMPKTAKRAWISRIPPPGEVKFSITNLGDCDKVIEGVLEDLWW